MQLLLVSLSLTPPLSPPLVRAREEAAKSLKFGNMALAAEENYADTVFFLSVSSLISAAFAMKERKNEPLEEIIKMCIIKCYI